MQQYEHVAYTLPTLLERSLPVSFKRLLDGGLSREHIRKPPQAPRSEVFLKEPKTAEHYLVIARAPPRLAPIPLVADVREMFVKRNSALPFSLIELWEFPIPGGEIRHVPFGAHRICVGAGSWVKELDEIPEVGGPRFQHGPVYGM
jgi:hypothetical protein